MNVKSLIRTFSRKSITDRVKLMSLINKIKKFFRKDKTEENKAEKLNAADYIGKFVKQKGNDIGESVAVSDARFIIKNKDDFLSVPVQAILKNHEFIEVGDFNLEECTKLGIEWNGKKDTLKFDEKGMMILETPVPK